MQTEYDYNNEDNYTPEQEVFIPTWVILLISFIGGLIVTWGIYCLID